MILAGRRINDGMGAYVVQRVVKLMNQRRHPGDGAKVLVMGLTFKENCPDLRNTRVVDIVREFRDYNAYVDVYDPWVDPQEAQHEYGIEPVAEPEAGTLRRHHPGGGPPSVPRDGGGRHPRPRQARTRAV